MVLRDVTRGEATFWKKISSVPIFNKMLTSRLSKECLQINKMEKKNPQKLGKRFEQALHTKGYPKGQSAYDNVFNTITHQ